VLHHQLLRALRAAARALQDHLVVHLPHAPAQTRVKGKGQQGMLGDSGAPRECRRSGQSKIMDA
jgi:hypothetical protein